MTTTTVQGNKARRIDVVIGTRPEAIKMAPVILELRSRQDCSARVIATGQHTEMLTQALGYFDLAADVNLGIMRERQSLDYVTAAVLQEVGHTFDADRPDAVLVHGDTTTTFSASLAAFYRDIPVGHVEAGLRSFDIKRPFPEEMNRVMTDRIATWWFAPTEIAKDNLLRENVREDGIYVTGNTVVDALFATIERRHRPQEGTLSALDAGGDPFLLLTAHRRESWGAPLIDICDAVTDILSKHDRYRLLVPMHKNPVVRDVIREKFADNRRVVLCEPLDYPDFVWALNRCALILSDSGGVQEEASAIRKPVLIMRDVTERPEAVTQGSGILVGTDRSRILAAADTLLSDAAAYGALQEKCRTSAFGDGHAAKRIADILLAD